MKVSHILYKVQDLHKGVEEFRAKGFVVEYGKAKNPYNALVYFSEGPYLEIMGSTGMPAFVKKLLRLFGKGKLVDRLDYWDTHSTGLCGLALENYGVDLNAECAIVEKHGISCVQMNSRRNDTKGRKLRFKVAFPNDMQLPFFMTYFNTDPKPKAFVHPNGIARVGRVTFGTRQELIPVIRELCDDPMLELCVGDEIQSLQFAPAPGHKQDKAAQ